MSESGYYPAGAENDPRAPWNEVEGEECPDCKPAPDDVKILMPNPNVRLCEICVDAYRKGIEPGGTACEELGCRTCDGTGAVAPPTRQEIKQRRDEIRADQEGHD